MKMMAFACAMVLSPGIATYAAGSNDCLKTQE